MTSSLITITNVSKQAIPVIIDSIDSTSANTASDLAASISTNITLQPGAKLTVEAVRTDSAQLSQLKKKSLIIY